MQVLRAKTRSVGVRCILRNILQIRGYAPINDPSRDAKYQAASEASMQLVPGEEDKGNICAIDVERKTRCVTTAKARVTREIEALRKRSLE
jgi:hypothetical protein